MSKNICCFAWEILNLISSGEKESLKVIEEKISKNILVEYIISRYGGRFSCDYDCVSINSILGKYSGCMDGVEDRKYGLTNEDDGLLVIIALIIEELSK